MTARPTQIWRVLPEAPEAETIAQAASILRKGGLVAFPTETVYGLGANGLDERAVAGIFAAKGRPSDNPLILHIADREDLDDLVEAVPDWLQPVLDAFWPGPLSVVLKRHAKVPDIVTAGLDTVAVRLPDSKVARALIRAAGFPIAAPSANASGRPSPTSASAVLADLENRIDGIIDAGTCKVGLESTVLDCTGASPVILRPGGVTQEMLEAVLGKMDAAESSAEAVPRSPGMKYRHYAPDAPLVVCFADGGQQNDTLLTEVCKAMQTGKKVGVIVSDETGDKMPSDVVVARYGSGKRPADCAAGLYQALRFFDAHPVDIIVAEGMTEAGIGRAFMNRLRKAATSTTEE